MRDLNAYYILAFDTTTDAMQAEKLAKNEIPAAIMPVPREISSGCGLALRFLDPDEAYILEFLRNLPIRGTLYKMQTVKINGLHPIEKII